MRKKAGGDPGDDSFWKEVAAVCKRDEKGDRSADIDGFLPWVRRWSGRVPCEDEPVYMREIDQFQKSLKQPRELSSKLLQKIGTVELGIDVGALGRAGLIKLLLASPNKFTTRQNEGSIFSETDVTSLADKKRQSFLTAEPSD